MGSTDHKLYAVRVADGSMAWQFETGLGVNSSPAVEDGLVYFSSLDGKMYAVDAQTGAIKWSAEDHEAPAPAETMVSRTRRLAESELTNGVDFIAPQILE